MFKKILSLFETKSTWIKLLLLFILTMVFMVLIITKIFGYISIDSKYVMDSANYYNAATFIKNIEELGQKGRTSYLLLHLFDYFYIAFSYLFFAMLLYLLIRNNKNYHILKYIPFLPFMAGIFDLLENIVIDISILIYPGKINLFAILSGFFTTFKLWILYIVFILILLFGLIFFFRKVKNKKF